MQASKPRDRASIPVPEGQDPLGVVQAIGFDLVNKRNGHGDIRMGRRLLGAVEALRVREGHTRLASRAAEPVVASSEDLREKLLAASKLGSGLPVTIRAWWFIAGEGDVGAPPQVAVCTPITPRDLMKAAEQMANDALRITELEGELAAADALAEARAPKLR